MKRKTGFDRIVYEEENSMNNLPNDPVMLMSFLNLKLRDQFDSLDALCDDYDVDKQTIIDKLAQIGFEYDEGQNQFK